MAENNANGTTDGMVPAGGTPVGETGAPAGSEVSSEGQGAATTVAPKEPTTEEILKFDPFGPAVEETKPKVEDAGKKVEKGGEQKPVAPAPTPTPPVQKTPREMELEGQVAALRSVIEKSSTPQAPKQAEGKPAEQPAAKYNLAIPEPLLGALRSEDDKDFGLAMNSIVNGIANRIYQDVKAEMAQQAEQLPMKVQEVVHNYTAAQQRTEQVRRDFYGAYPHLNNPMLFPLVQQAAAQVASNWTAQGKPLAWSQEFMGEMAQLIHQVIPVPQQQQQPAPQAPARVQPPYQARPGTRPAAAPPDEFMEMLGSVR